MNEAAALELWDDLKRGFINQERILVQIINEKAWEPLGYTSFVEAWNDRMQGVRLATGAIKAHVVYALLDDGTSEADVARLLSGSGVGPSAVSDLSKKRAAGVPPSMVRAHYRRPPSAAATVHVELSAPELAYFRGLSERRNLDMHGEMAKAIRSWFARLERAKTDAGSVR